MPSPTGTCETCAAFVRVREDERLGKIGECALEVFPPPLRAGSTCSRHRPKGALAPPPPPRRAAGQPRRAGSATAPRPRVLQTSLGSSAGRDLPEEIDIDMDIEDFRRVLREVLADELGVSQPELGGRWQGGEVILKPGKEGTQEKRVPIEAFFHKIVMIRDKLRVLEQKLNAHTTLTAEEKVQLQAYITGCYGSLTTFNVLFAEKGDQFTGAAGKDD
ncbi:MAG: hypothetical protein U0271_01955 [Polyangiaceae bacterium]